MRQLIKDQKGSILPLFGVVVVLVFMVAAVAVDFGRYVLAAEKLQTATDAASSAAASTAKRYVKLEINRGKYRTTCPKPGGGSRPCCKSCNETITVTGREDQLIDRKGYKKYFCSCGKGKVKILDRWVKYEGNGTDAIAAAKMFFNINKPKEMSNSQGGESSITSIKAFNSRSDPRYPSVIVNSEGSIKTLMMDFIEKLYPENDASSLKSSKCSQGGTFYYDTDGHQHRAAEEGC